jgi:hypothetical protein
LRPPGRHGNQHGNQCGADEQPLQNIDHEMHLLLSKTQHDIVPGHR